MKFPRRSSLVLSSLLALSPAGSIFAADEPVAGPMKLTRSLVHTCRTLNEAGATVWLVEPQPYQPADPLRWLVWSAVLGRPVPRGVDGVEYDRIQGSTLEAFAAVAEGADVRIEPARAVWFDAAGKSLIGDQAHAYFGDGQHVSPEGMRRVYRGPYEAMVRAIATELRRDEGHPSGGSDARELPAPPVGPRSAAGIIER